MIPTLQLTWEENNQPTFFTSVEPKIVVGRPRPDQNPDLVLSDPKVSRPHFALHRIQDGYAIEDLGSKRGTMVDGSSIQGMGLVALNLGSIIQVGDTQLRCEWSGFPDIMADTLVDAPLADATSSALSEEVIETVFDLSATQNAIGVSLPEVQVDRAHFQLLLDLPLLFGTETTVENLAKKIVDQLVQVINTAERSALLLIESGSDRLLLKAYHSPSGPAVSETLSRVCLDKRQGFIWSGSGVENIGESISEHNINTGMYVPLLWNDRALGILCVDNPNRDSTFHDDEFAILLAVARYASMALVNLQLQDQLKKESQLKNSLLRQFSPKVAEELLRNKGRIKPGGQRTEVTLLCSDIRGFTKMAQSLDPDEVVEILNDYFHHIVPPIFACDGTVDKYIGDAVLAVFGSHQPDVDHHFKAVQSAWAMQQAIAALNNLRNQEGLVTCEMGIGVHCGEVVHGFIGSADRMEYTVIGDPVNRTSRLCDGAGPGEVLISLAIHERVWKKVKVEPVEIATKHEGALRAYRVTGLNQTSSI